jgi:hypothetical protein
LARFSASGASTSVERTQRATKWGPSQGSTYHQGSSRIAL